MVDAFTMSYQAAGVTSDLEDEALTQLVKRIRSTWPTQGIGRVAVGHWLFCQRSRSWRDRSCNHG